jgi:hypothetical protein
MLDEMVSIRPIEFDGGILVKNLTLFTLSVFLRNNFQPQLPVPESADQVIIEGFNWRHIFFLYAVGLPTLAVISFEVITSAWKSFPLAQLTEPRTRKACYAAFFCMLAQGMTGINIIAFLYSLATTKIHAQQESVPRASAVPWCVVWVFLLFTFDPPRWMGSLLNQGIACLKIGTICLFISLSIAYRISEPNLSHGGAILKGWKDDRTLGYDLSGFFPSLLLAIFAISGSESPRLVTAENNYELALQKLIALRNNHDPHIARELFFAYHQGSAERSLRPTQRRATLDDIFGRRSGSASTVVPHYMHSVGGLIICGFVLIRYASPIPRVIHANIIIAHAYTLQP